MNPKDKAKELVNKMQIASGEPINYNEAKECALICVEEILQFTIHEKSDLYYKFQEYWNEVKQEIDAL